jgi:hypothetical protein
VVGADAAPELLEAGSKVVTPGPVAKPEGASWLQPEMTAAANTSGRMRPLA